MRARYPDSEGFVERNGVRVHYESYEGGVDGAQTVLFLPTWSIVHARAWKAQVPYFARHFRVLTYDGRGNGLSDRPQEPSAYDDTEMAADALAVLDATKTDIAAIVALSASARYALLLAAEHAERVSAIAFIAPAVAVSPAQPAPHVDPGFAAAIETFELPQASYEGWRTVNRHYWQKHYRDFLKFFAAQKKFIEPHSTKQIEDAIGWGLETDALTLAATLTGAQIDVTRAAELAASIRCPVMVLHGDQDAIVPYERGVALSEAMCGRLVTLRGSGHAPHARDPVKVNMLLREFFAPPAPAKIWPRSHVRRKRALFISSPIGLGHARRDIAIANELTKRRPGLEIDWLAQHPVTELLKTCGARIHPASVLLANESAHIESESGEHDLHCFQAYRRMDEILTANFMVFHDVVREEPYDLWIGDEAWDLDYYLHENPELKRAAYAWLTDFVGWLPIADGGAHEASLAADYNAEMIEQIERFPRIRDRAIFVGNPDDIVPDRFGENMPHIRQWTREHYDFAGYINGFDPVAVADRVALRAELGYRDDEKLCVVTVGGSGVGESLLKRVIASYPETKARVPALRMLIVAGPRIDPSSLPNPNGLEIKAFVPDLYRHLAACDIAVVQGGLTTTMELTANRRPFLYFPLRHHFEQNFHVRHRLERYGAGRRMSFADSPPETIASAIAEELTHPVAYREVETDGAVRAAALIAELV